MWVPVEAEKGPSLPSHFTQKASQMSARRVCVGFGREKKLFNNKMENTHRGRVVKAAHSLGHPICFLRHKGGTRIKKEMPQKGEIAQKNKTKEKKKL